ncbi:MAG: hypothetical protein KF804_10225 [Burkholderiales bacterium]|nr:hypothetical protein [Burkholderiales bacterium]
MRTVIQPIVLWVFRHFLLFLLIVGMLLAADYLRKEFTRWGSDTADLSRLEVEQGNVDEWQKRAKADLSSRVAQLKAAPAGALSERLAAIAKTIETKEQERQQLGGLRGLLTDGAVGSGIAARLRLDLEIELLAQERDHLAALLSALGEPENLENLRRRHVLVHARLLQNEAEQARLRALHPVQVFVPATAAFHQYRQLQESHEQLARENLVAYEDYKRQEGRVRRIQDSPPVFGIREDRIEAIVSPLNAAIEERRRSVRDNWFSKLSQPVSSILQIALLILLAVILAPLVIKALFYYVFAPLAARRPPIRILPEASGQLVPQSGDTENPADPARFTAVSKKLTLAGDEVLLIHPEYLQSTPRDARIDTKWLLDWSLPLSSLVSGMVALSRVRCGEPTTIVVSPTRDALSEVGVLDLPEGSALVFQPRNLVGVVHRSDRPFRITRHWRLASLHAWLTLQLRYVVFHGPARLIVKGCRGARIEAADTGRRINQAGTMGFSANLWYSTTRCETFVPYLMGEQALLNDSFAGAPGYYVYEETPDFGRKTGLTGRGLEGVFDSLLKVFGL